MRHARRWEVFMSVSVVIAYRIVEAATREALEAALAEALKEGWQPLGGLAISNGIFYQTLVGC